MRFKVGDFVRLKYAKRYYGYIVDIFNDIHGNPSYCHVKYCHIEHKGVINTQDFNAIELF